MPVGKRFARLAAWLATLLATIFFLEPPNIGGGGGAAICGIGNEYSAGWFFGWFGLGCGSDGFCWVSFGSWFEYEPWQFNNGGVDPDPKGGWAAMTMIGRTSGC